MTPRQHQLEFRDICRHVSRGAPIRKIVCNVTPGGGKSLLPMIAAAELGYKVCWLVPRVALQTQAEEVFQDEALRGLAGYTGRGIRQATNEAKPSRGFDGFTTTYQALTTARAGQFDEIYRTLSGSPYILVLDEAAHIHEDAKVAAAVKKLAECAKLVILMSGTMERHDGGRISFLKYKVEKEDEEENDVLDMSADSGTAVINYTRADALRDQAIIPLRATYLDASASWKKGEKVVEVSSLKSVKGSKASRALFVALKTEYALALLDACVVDWGNFAESIQYSSRLLVVAPNQKEARRYHEHLKKNYAVTSALAIEEEGAKAQRAIKDFRRSKLQCLVTVQMAYEGLDVPEISHVAVLTRIRSKPWLDQCLSRATRIDKSLPYDLQEAHVFVPDDTKMRRIITLIEKEQAEVIKRRSCAVENALPSNSAPRDLFGDIIPISSTAHGKRSQRLFSGVSEAIVTPSEKEMAIREEIEAHVRQYAAKRKLEPSVVNGKIKAKFGKSRTEMTLDELAKVKNWAVSALR